MSLLSHSAGVEGLDRCTASACSLLYGLDLKTNKCLSSALAPQIQTHLIWIPIHSGWVSLADFAVCSLPAVKKQSALQNQAQMTVHCERFIGSVKPDISHVLVSYLHRCLSHHRMPSPWKCHSLLLSSPAGRHSASRSCPECICHCHCTSQGIPLQGKQPHIQTHSKHKATRPGKGLIKTTLSLCLQLISPLPLGVFPPGMNLLWCQDGGDYSVGSCFWLSQEVLTAQPHSLHWGNGEFQRGTEIFLLHWLQKQGSILPSEPLKTFGM